MTVSVDLCDRQLFQNTVAAYATTFDESVDHCYDCEEQFCRKHMEMLREMSDNLTALACGMLYLRVDE